MKLLREPLLHFVLLAGALFALHGWLAERRGGEDRRIVITQGRIAQLAAAHVLMHQRAPDAAELRALVDDAIREEVLYREALALGLDRDDTIVRRRLRQKLEFVSEDVGAVAEPDDEALQAFLDAHPAQFAAEPSYRFEQVYLAPGHRDGEGARVLAALRGGARAADVGGDPLPLPSRFDAIGASEVARLFGTDFEAALAVVPIGDWQGPLPSSYGLHLVRVASRAAAHAARLADVRPAVRDAWLQAQREAANARRYAALRARYEVTVAPIPATLFAAPPSPPRAADAAP